MRPSKVVIVGFFLTVLCLSLGSEDDYTRKVEQVKYQNQRFREKYQKLQDQYNLAQEQLRKCLNSQKNGGSGSRQKPQDNVIADLMKKVNEYEEKAKTSESWWQRLKTKLTEEKDKLFHDNESKQKTVKDLAAENERLKKNAQEKAAQWQESLKKVKQQYEDKLKSKLNGNSAEADLIKKVTEYEDKIKTSESWWSQLKAKMTEQKNKLFEDNQTKQKTVKELKSEIERLKNQNQQFTKLIQQIYALKNQ